MEIVIGIGIAIGLGVLVLATWLVMHRAQGVGAVHHGHNGRSFTLGHGGNLPFYPDAAFVVPPRECSAFERDDRSIAQMCVDLMVTWSSLYNADERDDAAELRREIRNLGRELYRSGGMPRMRQVAVLGCKIGRERGLRDRDFDYHWDGIGDWVE